ncbi:MAG TPA: SMC-Scp complex subunit ScpB [Candidatus Paceibacterota bacterium]
MTKDLISKLEAALFYLAEPISLVYLSKVLEVSKKDIESAVVELSSELSGRGVRLVQHEDEIMLVTAPELSGLIEKIIKEDRERDLGRAGIETLSIIAYKGFVSKKELEYIRGVNSQYALRNLLLRGLIERKNSDTDGRMVGYSITMDTLRFLGLGSISELPEYEESRKQLEITEEAVEENDDPQQ